MARFLGTLPRMGVPVTQSIWRALTLSLALYLLWVLATYLLEGRILLTFQRPADVGARLIYALIANILIGIGGSALVIRFLSNSGGILTRQTGFRGLQHATVAVVAGVVLGFAFYFVQGAPSFNPIVILNAYAQVLVVSVAEVLVCWSVIGSVSESLLRGTGRWVAVILAAMIASVLFGLYHFAHSPPFNTVGLVVFLTLIGLVTSAFFFLSRDVYGTIAFHNFLGIFGVIGALDASGNLASFERPVVPLLIMAVVAIAVLVLAHARLVKIQ